MLLELLIDSVSQFLVLHLNQILLSVEQYTHFMLLLLVAGTLGDVGVGSVPCDVHLLFQVLYRLLYLAQFGLVGCFQLRT